MKNKMLTEMLPFLSRRWGEDQSVAILLDAQNQLCLLCQENNSDPKSVRIHTEDNIFPCISLYRALQSHGIPPEEALRFLDESWSSHARQGAQKLKRVFQIPGLHRLYPAIFGYVARKQFGTAAGFHARFYKCGRKRCKFDMTKCLFLDTCRRYGCPELTRCFCHVDDVNNRDLHPNLCWNRTQFMGGGGEFCDFDIYVRTSAGETGKGK